MAFDLERARNDTPGCEKVLHLNNAGAALMPRPVVDAVVGHIKLESEIGGYEAAEAAHSAVARVYDAAAELVNCAREEIAIIENATRAWDMAFYSLSFEAGDRILTGKAEYASNYIAYLQVARRTGAHVEVIPNDEHGRISLSALADVIDDRVKLISLTHVPTNGGLINPAAEVGKIAKDAGVLYLLDACQSVGQMPLNVKEIGCHMLAGTGRKFLRGPRGTGFLFADRALIEELDPPFLDLHAAEWKAANRYEVRTDARRFENWETNYAGKIGLGVAIQYALDWGIETVWQRISELAEQLRIGLRGISGVTLHDLGVEKCGIVGFTVEGQNPEDLCASLRAERINVSFSPANYTLLDMEERGLQSGLVRASVHYYNSEEEIEKFCRVLPTVAV
jgi:cysteine desulfurase/selenocysteine lyase